MTPTDGSDDWLTSSFFSRSSIRCSSLYILLSSSVTLSDSTLSVDVVDGASINPNGFVFEDGVDVVSAVSSFALAPNSTKPSRSVGITTSCFGILTTPRLWSSRTSIILFFFLKSMVRGSLKGI